MTRRVLLGAAAGVLLGLWAPGAAAGRQPQPFQDALAAFSRLSEDGPEGREPGAWRRLSEQFDQAARAERTAAPEALYRAALCLEKADGLTVRPEAPERTATAYERVVREHPGTEVADDALLRLGRLREVAGDLEAAKTCYRRVLAEYPAGDVAALARRRLEEAGRPAELTAVRAWAAPGYTRVVVDLAGPAVYRPGVLPPAPEAGRPYRVYLDFSGAALAPTCAGCTEVGDGLLRQVRAARFSPQVVRVVLDLDGPASFRVFRLDAPSRVVIDLFQEGEGRAAPSARRSSPGGPAAELSAPGPKRLRVVVDPGHGGQDPGALGPGGLREKDVVLALARELGGRLEADLGCEVRFTRSDDRTVSLEERTAIANAFGADLFVSIHANASRSREANGVETYYLDHSSDRAARALAAQENASGEEGVSEIEHILTDVLLGSKVRESRRLAEALQRALVGALRRDYEPLRDLGVKRAPFYVLTGAVMPAVLVETAFISHPVESKRLADPRYRTRAAAALLQGVRRYLGGS